MALVKITDINEPSIAVYASLTESELRKGVSGSSVFIAESPKVIATALSAGCEPISLLCEEKHIYGDAAAIVSELNEEIPIYTAERRILAELTGYTLTRGVLCAMRRPSHKPLTQLLEGARRIAVIADVCDTTNIGSIFRSAAALGIDAVLLTTGTCDPLNRRSVRVSMGSVFLVPWNWIEEPISSLHAFGFKTLALALKPDSIPLDSPSLKNAERIAIILGTEGDGLSDKVIADADYSVVIPMWHNVDSLNVGAAAAVAFWELRTK